MQNYKQKRTRLVLGGNKEIKELTSAINFARREIKKWQIILEERDAELDKLLLEKYPDPKSTGGRSAKIDRVRVKNCKTTR